jgi:hypothetical protein
MIPIPMNLRAAACRRADAGDVLAWYGEALTCSLKVNHSRGKKWRTESSHLLRGTSAASWCSITYPGTREGQSATEAGALEVNHICRFLVFIRKWWHILM